MLKGALLGGVTRRRPPLSIATLHRAMRNGALVDGPLMDGPLMDGALMDGALPGGAALRNRTGAG